MIATFHVIDNSKGCECPVTEGCALFILNIYRKYKIVHINYGLDSTMNKNHYKTKGRLRFDEIT